MLPVLIRTARMALLASLTAGARRRGQQDSGESSSVGASVRRSRSAASLESTSAASTGSHSSGALGARIGGVSVESDRGSQGQGEGLDDSGSDFWVIINAQTPACSLAVFAPWFFHFSTLPHGFPPILYSC